MHPCLEPVELISCAMTYRCHRDAAPPIGFGAASVWICVKSPFHGSVRLKSPLSRLVPDANSPEKHAGHLSYHKSKQVNKLHDHLSRLAAISIARDEVFRSRMIPSAVHCVEVRGRNAALEMSLCI